MVKTNSGAGSALEDLTLDAQRSMTNLAATVAAYYQGLVAAGISPLLAERLTAGFQERIVHVMIGLMEKEGSDR